MPKLILNKIDDFSIIREMWLSNDIWIHNLYIEDKYGIKHTPIKDPLSTKEKDLIQCLTDYVKYINSKGGLDKIIKNYPKLKQ